MNRVQEKRFKICLNIGKQFGKALLNICFVI